uniref:Ribosomal protein S12 n=1 Tax=Wallaceina sp. Wsd TaxID=265973 RepID=H9AZI6_9TRYP|nr:ribosomal protein S12 [Wallaceina sp. Wsd]
MPSTLFIIINNNLFFCRSLYLYGLCCRFCLFISIFYVSPRLPSSGNRRIVLAVFYLYNFVWVIRVFFCCVFSVGLFSLFIIEGGGFIDCPGLKLFTRFI